MKRNTFIIIFVLLLSLLLSACAGGQIADQESPGENLAREPDSVIEERQPELESLEVPVVETEKVGPQMDSPMKEEAEKAPDPSTVTLSVDCLTVLDNPGFLDPAAEEIIPEDGFFLLAQEVLFLPGDTAFDVLQRTTREQGIHLEFSKNPALSSTYIEGIGNLYEFDAGALSGWTYLINGKQVGVGSSSYKLSSGDTVQWRYTLDQGHDVGGRVREK